jgi:hypothetical protein
MPLTTTLSPLTAKTSSILACSYEIINEFMEIFPKLYSVLRMSLSRAMCFSDLTE